MRQQINALTSTRAVAAILVVIHHFGHDVYPFSLHVNFFHNGNVAVSYFFVLSGFVLYISYKDKHVRYIDYLKRRIGRIVPVYLLALFLVICIVHHFDNYTFTHHAMREVLFSATFLQAFIPYYPLTLNGPGWTLSVEMFFYLLFPLLLSVQKRSAGRFLLLTILLFTASQAIHLWCFPIRHILSDTVTDTLFFNPLIHISQFMVGMIGGYLFGKVSSPNPKYIWGALLSFIAVFLLIAFRPPNISYQVGLIAPVFMLFILCVAISNPAVLNIRPFVFLGEISYGIYILQLPVYSFLGAMNAKYTHLPQLWFFYLALAALIITAALSYLFFEKPLRQRINSFAFAAPKIARRA